MWWSEALHGIGILALLLAAPGSLYLALLTIAAWRRPPAAGASPGAEAIRVVIVVPAHNESAGIAPTLRSLRAEAGANTRIVVIADNCGDDTAAVARAEGVEVLERFDTTRRGKGFALQWGFERITAADWFVIVDADTLVEPGFLAAMRSAMAAGADALQCRYLVLDPLASRRQSLGEVALAAWNVLRPRGRAVMGLSAGILGNGFALSRRTLDRVPYLAHSIVEDVEYHILLVRSGLKVGFVDGACVRGAMPERSEAAASQRARWEGGRLRLAIDRVPGLAREVLAGRVRLFDPLADLLLAPLALHCLLLLIALVGAGGGFRIAAATAFATVIVHVVTGLLLVNAPAGVWASLARAPLYILWKIFLIGRIASSAGRGAAWVRTERAGTDRT